MRDGALAVKSERPRFFVVRARENLKFAFPVVSRE
jgi:hypothetical protein